MLGKQGPNYRQLNHYQAFSSKSECITYTSRIGQWRHCDLNRLVLYVLRHIRCVNCCVVTTGLAKKSECCAYFFCLPAVMFMPVSIPLFVPEESAVGGGRIFYKAKQSKTKRGDRQWWLTAAAVRAFVAGLRAGERPKSANLEAFREEIRVVYRRRRGRGAGDDDKPFGDSVGRLFTPWRQSVRVPYRASRRAVTSLRHQLGVVPAGGWRGRPQSALSARKRAPKPPLNRNHPKRAHAAFTMKPWKCNDDNYNSIGVNYYYYYYLETAKQLKLLEQLLLVDFLKLIPCACRVSK